MAEERIIVNGVNASSGGYLSQPTLQEIQAVAIKQLDDLSVSIEGSSSKKTLSPELFAEKQHYKELQQLLQKKEPSYGISSGFDQTDLSKAGWGIIFAKDVEEPTSDEIHEALLALLKHRETQTNGLYKIFHYEQGENNTKFVTGNGGSTNEVNPQQIPYYLLIVGSPEHIPYEFQIHLSVQYAVGRIFFEGTSKQEILNQYRNYAQSVVETETITPFLPRTTTFFGINNNDLATQNSCEHLVSPLASRIETTQKEDGWHISTMQSNEESHTQFQQIIGGNETPALLFATSHGIAFPKGDIGQIPHQGGMLCSDWKETTTPNPLAEKYYFAGDHIKKDANMLGLIAFLFASYSAGTSTIDDFAPATAESSPATSAKRPFVACLPRQMLAHPGGGALAVVGHIDRVWSTHFLNEPNNALVSTLQQTITRLLQGHPIGSAMEPFKQWYAEIAEMLLADIKKIRNTMSVNSQEFANLWATYQDARNYCIVGDPAVRLPVVASGEPASGRPDISKELSPIPTCESLVTEAAPVSDELKQQLSRVKGKLNEALEKVQKLKEEMQQHTR